MDVTYKLNIMSGLCTYLHKIESMFISQLKVTQQHHYGTNCRVHELSGTHKLLYTYMYRPILVKIELEIRKVLYWVIMFPLVLPSIIIKVRYNQRYYRTG